MESAEQCLSESMTWINRLQAQVKEQQTQAEQWRAQTEEWRARAQALTAANEALRASEEKYRALIEASNSIIMKADRNLNITYMNRFGLEFFGYTAEELLGRNVIGTTIPEKDDRGRDLAAMAREIAGDPEGYKTNVHQNRRKNGELVWISWTNSIKYDREGRMVEILAVGNNISRLKQVEETARQTHEELHRRSEELARANQEMQIQAVQLQESEQRLRMALDGGRMGRWEWDLATESMFWCERTYVLLGLDPFVPARVETLLACVHPDDRQVVKERIARAVNDAADFQTEFRVLRQRHEPRSEEAWLALHAQVVRDGRGQAVRTIGVIYEVTARKQMEAELRRLNEKLEEEVQAQTTELRGAVDRLQEEVTRRVRVEDRLRQSSRLLEAFFRHTITPLAFLDRQFRFVRVNEAFARADGRTPEFFVHQDYFELYPSAENRALFEEVVRTKQPYQTRARLFAFSLAPQQALKYWNWHLTPLLDELGAVQFLVVNLEDVSEQQKAFGELEHRAHLLQKLTLELVQAEDRERRRLAEILHDDLQQTLAAVKFHLGLLRSRIQGDAAAQELAGHVNGMVKDAIEKSRSLSHELSPAVLYQGDLGETFEWLAQQVQAKHGLTVHTEVFGRVDTASEPIKAFLFRAAQEMLFNTIKHAQVSEARLRLQRRRGQLWLTIADRGRGFDPATLGRTTGFGLFSLRERVQFLGGRMKIHSAPGRGSVLLIAVADAGTPEDGRPRTEDGVRRMVDDRAAAAVVPPASSGSRLRVLLVDDHKTMREGLAALIGEQPDMEVVGQAGDGRKAVELTPDLSPDVVIMDVAMPTMPGDEATRQIKALLPQTRIVGLSMFEEPGVAHRMREAGADAYLLKSGPSERLLAAIRGQPVPV